LCVIVWLRSAKTAAARKRRDGQLMLQYLVQRDPLTPCLFYKLLNFSSSCLALIRGIYTLYEYIRLLLLFVLLPFWLPRSFDLQRGRVLQLPLT
jgi:hypothetical protein